MAAIGTFNEEGTNVDLYIPRKCHATNHLIESFDHSAIQITIANVDANGVADGTSTTLCITGYLRAQGESDHAINHLAIGKGIMRIKTGKKPRAKKGKTGRNAAGRGAAKGAQQQQKGARPVPGKRNAPAGSKGPQQKGSQQKGPQQKGSQQKGPQQKGSQQKGPQQKGPQRPQDQKQRKPQPQQQKQGGKPSGPRPARADAGSAAPARGGPAKRAPRQKA